MKRNLENVFNKNPDSKYRSEKVKQLDLYGNDLWAISEDPICQDLINRAAEFCGYNVDNIVDLALCLEEDIAILHDGKLKVICFCFPSNWIPKNKIDLELQQIHVPVADSEHLVLASQKLAQTMANQKLGSFRRTVWTITVNPNLSNHPKEKMSFIPKNIGDLYFRTELQTTYPLGDNASLFFVKVDVVPLITVWDTLGENIRTSINSMSENVLEYKNLSIIKTLLNNHVEKVSEP